MKNMYKKETLINDFSRGMLIILKDEIYVSSICC